MVYLAQATSPQFTLLSMPLTKLPITSTTIAIGTNGPHLQLH